MLDVLATLSISIVVLATLSILIVSRHGKNHAEGRNRFRNGWDGAKNKEKEPILAGVGRRKPLAWMEKQSGKLHAASR